MKNLKGLFEPVRLESGSTRPEVAKSPRQQELRDGKGRSRARELLADWLKAEPLLVSGCPWILIA